MGCCLENDMPEVPEIGEQYRGAIQEEIQMSPLRAQVEFDRLTGGAGSVNLPTLGNQPFEYDFTGKTDLDVLRELGPEYSQTLLDLQNQFGPQFIESAKAQLELSDPEGQQARRDLFGRISEDAARVDSTERPIAEKLAEMILADLEAGGTLDPESRREVQQSVRGGQAARGNVLGNAATFEEAMETGRAAEARRTGRQGRALGFLTSGATPEDVGYRREQQVMANLGAFLNNQTPTAQFSSLSGAQQQAAPYPNTPQMQGVQPTNNQGLWGVSSNFAASNYGNVLNWNVQQENPWVTGIGLVNDTIATFMPLAGGGGGGGQA